MKGISLSIHSNLQRLKEPKLDAKEVKLVLDLKGLLFNVTTKRVPVRLLSPEEILSHLIRLSILKKLPPGRHVLRISRPKVPGITGKYSYSDQALDKDAYQTNLVFLSRLFERIKQDDTDYPDEESKQNAEIYRNLATNIEATLSYYIAQCFRVIQERYQASGRVFRLRSYKGKMDPDHEYEKELNSITLLGSMLSSIPTTAPAGYTDDVWFTLYQTGEFLDYVDNQPAICVFGFKCSVPDNVQVLFDLDTLTTQISPYTLKVGQDELKKITAFPEELKQYVPSLLRILEEKNEQKIFSNTPSNHRFKDLLEKLAISANESLRRGQFINSEPMWTRFWVNLGIFGRKLSEEGDKHEVLGQAVYYLLDRIVEHYNVKPEVGWILNLCTEELGMADEFKILSQFQYRSYPTVPVKITSTNDILMSPPGSASTTEEIVEFPDYLRERFRNKDKQEEVIILAPFDSYVGKLSALIKEVTECGNRVIGIVALFSMASSWDYLSARDHFDIVPMFRLSEF